MKRAQASLGPGEPSVPRPVIFGSRGNVIVHWELDQTLRSILVCPICRGELVDVERGLLCPKDKRVFLVVENIPMMLEALSKPATPEELASYEA